MPAHSVPESPHDGPLRQHVSSHLKHDRGARGLLVDSRNLVDVECVYGEAVVMLAVALGGTRPAIGALREIVVRRLAPARRLVVAVARGERADLGGNVECEPVPVPGARRRVGVKADYGVARGSVGRARPGELRREIGVIARVLVVGNPRAAQAEDGDGLVGLAEAPAW